MTFPALNFGGLIRDRDQIWLNHAGVNPRSIRDAWTDWTPTTTNLTEGSGTTVARYAQIGNVVICHYQFTFAADSSISGGVTVSTPVTATSSGYAGAVVPVGTVWFKEDGGSTYMGSVSMESTTTFGMYALDPSGTYTARASISSTIPFTWGTSDRLSFTAIYEAAA